jgi:hypothetical protein
MAMDFTGSNRLIRLSGAFTVTTDLPEVDAFGYRSLVYVVSLGAGSTGTATLKAQSAPAGGAFADVAGVAVVAANKPSKLVGLERLEFAGSRRQRLRLEITGVVNVESVLAILSEARREPVDITAYGAWAVFE